MANLYRFYPEALFYATAWRRPKFIQAGLLATADTSSFICSGVSASFAVKLFKSWLSEKDISSVTASLRKVGMDNRLMVRHRLKHLTLCEDKMQ